VTLVRLKGKAGVRKRADWIAFASGTLLSAVVWLAWHPAPPDADSVGVYAEAAEIDAVEFGSHARPSTPAPAQKQPVEQISRTAAGSEARAPGKAAVEQPAGQPLSVEVYLTSERRTERVDLETYVSGVVAGEMPINFEPAALEAQAMAARTYIVRRLMLNLSDGVPGGRGDVTDTVTHQVYRSQKQMDELRKNDPDSWRKVKDAVKRTADVVLAYNGEPIEALYFASGGGYTENSEDVFSDELPYLRSVASPWDAKASPNFKEVVTMSMHDFYAELGVKDFEAAAKAGNTAVRILDYTSGRRVKRLSAGAAVLSGVEVRSRLGLRSAAFELKRKDGQIVITTYGNGHGVGMSQWGAQGMAKQGYSARQIVEHYYSDITLEKVSKLLNDKPENR